MPESAQADIGKLTSPRHLLPAPCEFVFEDADQERYLQCFRDPEAKMGPGGCYTAHKIARSYARQVIEFPHCARTRPGKSD